MTDSDKSTLENDELRSIDNVFVVVIDGLRSSEGFDDPNHRYIPNIWNNLRPKGTIYSDFFNMGVTGTTSGHATITSGSTQFIRNNWTAATGHLNCVQEEPSIFQYYREQKSIPMEKTWLINGKGPIIDKIGVSFHPYYRDLFSPSVSFSSFHSDDSTWSETQRAIETYKPSLTLINFKEVDDIGHKGVWEDYTKAILHVDSIIYDLFCLISEDPHYNNNTVFILTSDHGRHLDNVSTGFQDHGCCCLGCRRVPLLVIGPNIRENVVVTKKGYLRDIAPTIAYMLEIDDIFSNGRILEDIFDSPPPASRPSLYQPSITCDKAKFHLTATCHKNNFTHILYANSSNNGQQWENITILSENKNNFGPSISSEGNNVAVAWNTYQDDGSCIVAYRESADGGMTWGDPLYFTGNNKLEIDISPSVNISQDIATLIWCERTYLHIVKIQNGTIIRSDQIYVFDLSMSSLAVSPPDTHAVYHKLMRTLKIDEIFYCRDSGNGWIAPIRISLTSGDSIHPSVAVDEKGIHAVWTENDNGTFRIAVKNSQDGIKWDDIKFIDNAYYGSWHPNISVSSDKLVVAWENYETKNSAILSAFSMDNGATWSDPINIADTINLDTTPAIAISSFDLMLLCWIIRKWQSQLVIKSILL